MADAALRAALIRHFLLNVAEGQVSEDREAPHHRGDTGYSGTPCEHLP